MSLLTMLGFSKKTDPVERVSDIGVRIYMLEIADADNRKMIRTLIKSLDEAERVQARMAKTIADHAEKIRVLTEQVAEHCEKLEAQSEFNEFVAATGMDGSDEVLAHRAEITKHRGQLAGLWKGLEKVNNILVILKGRT
jgi:uncharacterized coiled-coil protein SlyX